MGTWEAAVGWCADTCARRGWRPASVSSPAVSAAARPALLPGGLCMATRGVWQLKRLVLKFCDISGSSRGAREFMETQLPAFQSANAQLEVEAVLNRGRHPNLHGFYRNGRDRVVDVKNQTAENILEAAARLRNSTGRKVVKLRHRHVTQQPSIQGTWTPHTWRRDSGAAGVPAGPPAHSP